MKAKLPQIVITLIALSVPLSECLAQRGGSRGGGRGGGGQAQTEPGLTPKNLGTLVKVYPYELLMAGTEGSAEVTFIVDANGMPTTLKIGKATTKEMGFATLAVVEEMEYQPLMKDGKPLASDKQTMTFTYSKAEIDDSLLEDLKKPNAFVPKEQLDGGHVGLIAVADPKFPSEMTKAKVNEGKATIEIVIDHDGTVKLPRIVSATNDSFGYSAAAAAARFRFEPPTKDSKPVYVKLSLPFNFKAPAPVVPAGKK